MAAPEACTHMLLTYVHVPFSTLVTVVSVILAACFVAAASMQHGNMFNKVNVQASSDPQSQTAFVSKQEAFCDIKGLV